MPSHFFSITFLSFFFSLFINVTTREQRTKRNVWLIWEGWKDHKMVPHQALVDMFVLLDWTFFFDWLLCSHIQFVEAQAPYSGNIKEHVKKQ